MISIYDDLEAVILCQNAFYKGNVIDILCFIYSFVFNDNFFIYWKSRKTVKAREISFICWLTSKKPGLDQANTTGLEVGPVLLGE